MNCASGSPLGPQRIVHLDVNDGVETSQKAKQLGHLRRRVEVDADQLQELEDDDYVAVPSRNFCKKLRNRNVVLGQEAVPVSFRCSSRRALDKEVDRLESASDGVSHSCGRGSPLIAQPPQRVSPRQDTLRSSISKQPRQRL